MNIRNLMMSVAVVGMFAGHTLGQHAGDVILVVENGRVVTGIEDDSVFEPWRLWVEDIDEDITDEPGFDSLSGTFDPGASVGVAIRKALRSWDYENGHFNEIAEETMVISRFDVWIETPASDPRPGSFPELQLGLASATGVLHVHAWFELIGDGAPSSDGIYLLELEMWTSMSGVQNSEPFWIIFTKNEDDEDVVHEAEEWVIDNLIDPVPANCPADLTRDGTVNVFDLLALLGQWGACPPAEAGARGANGNGPCAADLTGDGMVNVFDLLELLAMWGTCPE